MIYDFQYLLSLADILMVLGLVLLYVGTNHYMLGLPKSVNMLILFLWGLYKIFQQWFNFKNTHGLYRMDPQQYKNFNVSSIAGVII